MLICKKTTINSEKDKSITRLKEHGLKSRRKSLEVKQGQGWMLRRLHLLLSWKYTINNTAKSISKDQTNVKSILIERSLGFSVNKQRILPWLKSSLTILMRGFLALIFDVNLLITQFTPISQQEVLKQRGRVIISTLSNSMTMKKKAKQKLKHKQHMILIKAWSSLMKKHLIYFAWEALTEPYCKI